MLAEIFATLLEAAATFGFFLILFAAYAYFSKHPGNRNRKRSLIVPLAWMLLAVPTSAQQIYNVLPTVNVHRARFGYNQLIERQDLQIAAEKAALQMATKGWLYQGRKGHKGEMLSGTCEGVGMQSGSDPAGNNFYSCYHVYHAPGKPGASRNHIYGGAAVAIVGNQTYYALELDNDTKAGGPVGLSQVSQSSRPRRRFFRRSR